ncbi:MAG TPA: TonB-dependent receptor [Flavobacterium sp.]|mgnify:CR=1 FL=1|jgi:TonB-linked SusC/RagA family outer membrane protein|uniref:SusC/RagA family TonB-linked outer membrane protein n=1 Tax=unclassified Flavobacterium TaxID=196869 RepID=UPI000E99736F|nr:MULTISPECIES: TonB-dependent receptor [unclassified Flavobacterium]HBI01939.1 SusC/RagA family TonB-linked outer membrane protein [Flavobacterium sp.]HRE79101.1 TonB-dependent receptor [Flavobacterium sp.]
MRSKFKWIFTLLVAFFIQFSYAQEKTITGVVTESGLPLPGATVLVKGTSRGTSTDFDGKYSIQAKAGEVLEFSYVGMKTQNVTVATSNTVNIALVNDTALDEVVVVAYGSSKKSELASAVSVVSAKSIEQVPIASLDQILQGNVAGMTVSTGSGQPGQSASVRIRGTSSLSGTRDPLYVLDGVPIDANNFRSINANDIETMSVLKDASATVLYGSRGAAGVIVITTKKGKYNSGLKVQYRSMFGISLEPDPQFEVMNASQYLTWQRDVLGAGYGATGSSGSIIGTGPLTDTEIAAISRQTNTNWSDIFFRQGTTTSHELNISSGNDVSRSFTSIGYFEQEGITLNSDLKRFTFRTNLELKPNDKFRFAYNLTFNYSKNSFVVDRNRVGGGNTGGELDNPFIVPYLGMPYQSPYNPDGSINIIGTQLSGAYNTNPDGSQGAYNISNANGFQNTPYLALNTARFNTDDENELKAVGQINADYKILPDVKFGGSLGVDYTNIESLFITHPLSIRGDLTPAQTSVNKGTQFESFARDAGFNINTFLTYQKTFKEKHNLEASIFSEYYYNSIRTAGYQAYGLNPALVGSGSGFTAGNLLEGGQAIYAPNAFSSNNELAIFSYFGVLNYNYTDKYGIQLSARRDASSRFLEENRWGTFWSASARWNISSEKFMENSKVFSDLKLRASYGTTGNQGVGGFYVGYETIAGGDGYGANQAYFPGIADSNLKWETTKQANIGLDFGLFNRLTGSVDVYDKQTEDLFFLTQLPTSTGFGAVNKNIGEMSNKGIELQLNYGLIKKSDLTVDVFFNGSYNKNEILQLDGLSDFQGTGATRLQVGEAFGTYNTVRYLGADPSNGQPLYLDIDGNVTNVYSLDDRVSSGKSFIPKYTGGFGLNASYKGFQLSTLFSFAAEQYRLNSSLAIIEDVSLAGFANQSTTMLDAWQQPGDITSIPSVNFPSIRLQNTDRYLEDASYLRLRNITLAYILDGNKFQDSKYFSSVRLYVQAQNMFTWTKYRGFDPESNQSTNFFDYPTPRQFTFGVDINL